MLSLYRRHKRECKAGHAYQLHTSESDERKKGWKRCDCPIVASGTLNKIANRKSTGQWEWEPAIKIKESWDASGNWDGLVTTPAELAPLPPQGTRITVAITEFLAEFTDSAAPNTVKKYKIVLGKLESFSESLGYVMVEQWTTSDVRSMRRSWAVSPQTRAKNTSTIKSFFRFCVANQWITRNPAEFITERHTRSAADTRHDQKLPFTDDELKRMYEACETTYGKKEIAWSRNGGGRVTIAERGSTVNYKYKWTGQDLADFISISIYTGLRISDVATFHADRLKPTGEILLRTVKGGTHVYTWVPEWLQERIRERSRTVGLYIFGEHETEDLNVITDVWRRKLKNLWALCGDWSAPPTPHRFRHTFARILLQRPSVTVRDVAELLGNSEQMVRKHYAAWIPERQARLTSVLKAAFSERQQPALIKTPTRA